MRVSRAVVAVASVGVLALSACSGSASSVSMPSGASGATGASGASGASDPAATTVAAPSGTLASASAPSASASAIAANQGRWEALPAGPLPALNDPVGVWTGDELVVVGRATTPGHAIRAAAYRPASRSWRALPAPSSAGAPGSDVRTSGRIGAVWTGRQLVIIGGGFCHTLDPVTGTWRRLTDPTGVTADVEFAMVWTGSRVLLWGVQAGTVGWSVDPTTDTWTTLPAAPITPELDSGVWTGSEFVVLSSANPARVGVYQPPAAYDPAKNAWRVLPAAPQGRADPAVVWTGREVVVLGGGQEDNAVAKVQAAYAPTRGVWRRLADGAGLAHGERVDAGAVWTGRQVLVWGGGRFGNDPRRGYTFTPSPAGAAYDPDADTWVPLPRSPLQGRSAPVVAWTGTSMIVWGGVVHPGGAAAGRPVTDGAVYTP